MLAFVEVSDNHVEERRGVNRDTGRAYHLRQQSIYLHQGAPYPEKFELMLEENQPAYEPGKYLLAAGSFERHYKTGALSFSRNLKLLPVAEAVLKLTEMSGSRIRGVASAAG